MCHHCYLNSQCFETRISSIYSKSITVHIYLYVDRERLTMSLSCRQPVKPIIIIGEVPAVWWQQGNKAGATQRWGHNFLNTWFTYYTKATCRYGRWCKCRFTYSSHNNPTRICCLAAVNDHKENSLYVVRVNSLSLLCPKTILHSPKLKLKLQKSNICP